MLADFLRRTVAPHADTMSAAALDEARRFLDALMPGQEVFDFRPLFDTDRQNRRMTLTGRLDDLAPELHKLNRQGWGIYVELSAPGWVFIDADTPGFDPEAPNMVVPPTMVVETGPGRRHLYWRVHDYPLTMFLAHIGTSWVMVQTAEFLPRLPGFFNRKRTNPEPVRLILYDPSRSYSRAEMVAAIEGESF